MNDPPSTIAIPLPPPVPHVGENSLSSSLFDRIMAAMEERRKQELAENARLDAQLAAEIIAAVQEDLDNSALRRAKTVAEQHTVEREQQCSTDQRNAERERDESESSEISKLTCEFSDYEEEQSTKFHAEFDERAQSAIECECEITITQQDAIQPRTVIDLQLDISDIASSFLSNAAAEQK